MHPAAAEPGRVRPYLSATWRDFHSRVRFLTNPFPPSSFAICQMQTGFAMLEVGTVNKKNTSNILLKVRPHANTPTTNPLRPPLLGVRIE